MPATRPATAPQPPPSSVSIGKKPMAYPPQPATQQQQQRSARAASKAPLAYPVQQQGQQPAHPHRHPSPPSSTASGQGKGRAHGGGGPAAPSASTKQNKIWSTSTIEERERIKDFWLGLGEEERRNLVKIEKDTVLRKMKEQQKHSCSCAVCGRKRNAIEEELEVLYDAYYEELEQYANYQQRYVLSGGTIPPPPVQPPHLHPHPHPHPHDDEEPREVKPSRRDNTGHPPSQKRTNGIRPKASDGLFNLKNSLTVTGPGNILTVADDLLKNDGQKFLEMMEQLAERRMQREEEAAIDVEDDSDEDEIRRRGEDDEEEEDEEDEEDEEEEEDEDDEDDEDEEMTEEQKSEEGKRMFSIFAARMFEQRVLQAYREKVAQERQMQLLRELEDEDKLTKEREAKKQTANQRKKDKRKQQKLAKDEEKAAKAAEKAAEEAAQKARQATIEEENRKKREEERARREAVKKAAEEERIKKEDEKRKRLLEEKEREAERERKKREKEEKAKAERREREERERKVREEKEARLAKEREERLERERVEKEKAEKARQEKLEKEQAEKAEREKKLAKEREEKAEREARERLNMQHQQQRNVVSPTGNGKSTVGRAANRSNAVASSSSSFNTQQRIVPGAPSPNTVNGTTKKMSNKVPPIAPSASAPVVSQSSRPQQPHQPPRGTSMSSQPQTPITPQISHHLTPLQPPMMFPGPPGMIPPMSPRVQQSFVPMGYGYSGLQQQQQHSGQPGLAPSPLPRNFAPSAGQPFDPAFGNANRSVSISPIGPPLKIKPPGPLPASPSAPSVLSLAPGQRRRGSLLSVDPGPIVPPISRPIVAPIARPSVSSSNTNGNGEGSSSSSSPIRSPSPKGVLGSSALVEDGDEVVKAPAGRRGGSTPLPIGTGLGIGGMGTPGQQNWGPTSPRSLVGAGTPWGPPGFGNGSQQQRPIGPPPPVGPLNTQQHPTAPLWGNPGSAASASVNGTPDWHNSPGSGFFNSPNPGHFPVANAASPPPNTGN
ncbi:Stress response protein nst1 [Termitomyces sp. J132]|nr:Stress response protein nst1 [Termitomyces sp. J132]